MPEGLQKSSKIKILPAPFTPTPFPIPRREWRAPLSARETSWQALRGGENCCHSDRLDTSDLQKPRHLQKRRVTERHNRGTTRKLKSHLGHKRRFAPFLGRGVRLQFSLCAPIVPLRDATFLQMTRLLQVTRTILKL